MRSLFAFAFALPACAGQPRHFEALILPIEFAAPTCCEGGPSAEILRAHKTKCGKGDECAVLDLRLRNPTNRPLFFLLDARDGFSGYLEAIDILRPNQFFRPQNAALSGPEVWEFTGQNLDRAIRLPPGADITIRNLGFFLTFDEFEVAFAEHLVLNHDRFVDGETSKALTPPSGEFDMKWLDDVDVSRVPLYPLDGKEGVSLDTWCTQKIPVAYEGH